MKLSHLVALLCALLMAFTLSGAVWAEDGHVWSRDEAGHRCIAEGHADSQCDYREQMPHTFTIGICTVCGYAQAAIPAPGSHPIYIPEADPATWVVGSTTTTSAAFVYSAPSFDSKTATILTAGTVVPVLDWANNNGFTKVSVEGSVRYVTSHTHSVPAIDLTPKTYLLCDAAVLPTMDLNATPIVWLKKGDNVNGYQIYNGADISTDTGWFYDYDHVGYIWGASVGGVKGGSHGHGDGTGGCIWED